jgi:octaprenyl-diphosphate synthase
VDVQRKGGYTLAFKKNRGEGDHRRVGRAQKFLHEIGLLPPVARGKGGKDGMDGVGDSAVDTITTPPDKLSVLLAEDMAAVNRLIRQRMASEHAPRIPEVTSHLVEAGGKRLRPLLTLAAARMLGYQGQDHVKLAATVEFIHTATLLHDDVVDESQRRRGRPTANLLWDNKSSVLVGDYLFSRSFQLMVETGSLRVLDILANASATIAEGEVLQLTAAQDLATDETIYLQVIRGKTAALFAAATEVGGVIAGSDDRIVAALRDYGDALGIAFQIVDDILDYGGSDAVIGKNTGDDFRERKLTLPLIKAVAKATPEERAFWMRVIEKNDQRDGDLAHAMVILQKHDAISACRSDALVWAGKAKAALNNLPVHPLRDTLSELADFVVSRVT